ncbi:MAG TPA: DUF6249 domain-containing protein [Acidobacteriaceae bacterium]|nr:DUF6249 domain-containing protein [Acidobacteriaceae bacterium]
MRADTGPFLIVLGAFAMVLGIVIVAKLAEYHNKKLKSEERLTAIAKGLPLPPDIDKVPGDRRPTAAGIRTGGIICISTGVGLAVFSFFLAWIVQEHDVLSIAAAGLIPLFIGIGLLIDYALRTRSARAEANQPAGVRD